MVKGHPTVTDRLHSADEAVFRFVADWETPVLDATLPKLSEAANYSRLWILTSVVLGVFGGERGRRVAVSGLAAVGVTSALTNIFLKAATRRARPQTEVPGERRLDHPGSSSFPSGHTASAAAFSGVVGRELPALWIPLNLAAGAVGLSRVYTGVHYPGDVVVGWIVGKGVAAATRSVARRFFET